jgi:hypothetical protein
MLLVYDRLITLLLLLTIFYHEVWCLNIYKRKKIVVHGDLMIGALLPVHEQPSFDNEDHDNGPRRKCGIIRDQYGKLFSFFFLYYECYENEYNS